MASVLLENGVKEYTEIWNNGIVEWWKDGRMEWCTPVAHVASAQDPLIL